LLEFAMKILLIDDDEASVKSLSSFLGMANHCCQAFTIPEQAIAAYRRNAYDVVITDMVMPGMNGLEVLQRIRSINPDVRVIIVTGHLDIGIISAALNNRAYAFLAKPLSIEELMATLGRIEQENRDLERAGWEHGRLAMEYARLKRAFEDLQDLLKEQQRNS
jgi:two-component system C4-dicarboxylate transport response regulator DctD